MVYHHPTRKSVGYFAAVRLRDGEILFRRETGRFNGETIWEFLQVCFGKPVPFPTAAFWPSATTHHIIAPNSIGGGATSRLPSSAWTSCRPISPDLNPIERVWKLTRRLCLHNRYFGLLDGVVAAVEGQFAQWTKPNDALRRLCAIT